MTQDEAFLRAIIEEPDDDSVRLIYADWMIEQGRHDRAEFVQVQIALAQERKKPGWTPTPQDMERYGAQDLQMLFRCNNYEREDRIDDLRCREKELLSILPALDGNDPNRADGWMGGSMRNHWGLQAFAALKGTGLLNSRQNEPGFDWEFRRGFVEAIVISWEDFKVHSEALLAAAPVRGVSLATSPKLSWHVGRGQVAYSLTDDTKCRTPDDGSTGSDVIVRLLAQKYGGRKFNLIGEVSGTQTVPAAGH